MCSCVCERVFESVFYRHAWECMVDCSAPPINNSTQEPCGFLAMQLGDQPSIAAHEQLIKCHCLLLFKAIVFTVICSANY